MKIYDIIIVGAGPAGLTAAIYAGRANKSVLVLEKGTFGGQITSSPQVENIPGFLSITGAEFGEKLVEQAVSLDSDIECCEVLGIKDGSPKTVITDEGEFYGKAVIIATGTKHRLLGLPKEKDFIGNGISFCAVCDGAFYNGRTVAVIGGGNSALQEAILLSDNCERVIVVQNLDYLTGEEKLQKKLTEKPNVEIITGAVVDSLHGDTELSGISIRFNDQSTRELTLDGIFIAIGLLPQNDAFADIISLNDYGYVDSGEDCLTNIEGIFVAGDCRSKKIRQVATAASDGATAALAACDYIK